MAVEKFLFERTKNCLAEDNDTTNTPILTCQFSSVRKLINWQSSNGFHVKIHSAAGKQSPLFGSQLIHFAHNKSYFRWSACAVQATIFVEMIKSSESAIGVVWIGRQHTAYTANSRGCKWLTTFARWKMSNRKKNPNALALTLRALLFSL